MRLHAHRLAALRGNDRRRYRLFLILLSPNIDNAAKSLSVNTEHDIVVNADLDLLWLLQPALLNVGADDTEDSDGVLETIGTSATAVRNDVGHHRQLRCQPATSWLYARVVVDRDLLVVWWKERPLSPQQQLRHPGPDAA